MFAKFKDIAAKFKESKGKVGDDGTPVYVNVYNLQNTQAGVTLNMSMGFGIFHSGIEVCGTEYTFGGDPDGGPAAMHVCGIYPMPPKSAMPAAQFHKQHEVGRLPKDVTPTMIFQVLLEMRADWPAGKYHLLSRNCNHFGEELLQRLSDTFLTARGFEAMAAPAYINRAARAGANVVPQPIYQQMMQAVPRPPAGKDHLRGPPGAHPPTPSQPPVQQHIRIGMRVQVQGLTSKPEYNRAKGLVVSFDCSKQRYAVRLDDGKELSLRPACLLQACDVLLLGGGSADRGMLVEADAEAGLYTIALLDSTTVQKPPTEVVLPNAAWVRLDGLVQKPELNGRCGAVQSFDHATGRYEIRLSSGEVLRIKSQNTWLES